MENYIWSVIGGTITVTVIEGNVINVTFMTFPGHHTTVAWDLSKENISVEPLCQVLMSICVHKLDMVALKMQESREGD